MTREEAIQYLEESMFDIPRWLYDLINKIYDESKKTKVVRTADEIVERVYDTVGSEAYCELSNDNFGAWLIGEDE